MLCIVYQQNILQSIYEGHQIAKLQEGTGGKSPPRKHLHSSRGDLKS